MMKFIPYVLKTLWRHRSRTILTVTGSAVAIFVFCFVGAVQEGMNDLQTRPGIQRNADRIPEEQVLPGYESSASGLRPTDWKAGGYKRCCAGAGVYEQLPSQLGCRCILWSAPKKTTSSEGL